MRITALVLWPSVLGLYILYCSTVILPGTCTGYQDNNFIVRTLQLLNFRSKLWTWWTAIIWECFLQSLQCFQCWQSGDMSGWSVGYNSCWLYCHSMEWKECPSGLHSAGIQWSTQCNLSENVWSMTCILLLCMYNVIILLYHVSLRGSRSMPSTIWSEWHAEIIVWALALLGCKGLAWMLTWEWACALHSCS